MNVINQTIAIHRFLFRLRKKELAEKIQAGIVWRLPRWAIYWAGIRLYSTAWIEAKTKEPNELTFDEVMGPWEPRR